MANISKNQPILLAEDDLAMGEIIERKLTNSGFKVIRAQNGKEALLLAKKHRPAAVLLDLMMPEMDGFTVLENLRKASDKKIAKMPVIVLSNLWDSANILKARKLKANDFLVKAYYTPEQIVGKLKDALLGKSVSF